MSKKILLVEDTKETYVMVNQAISTLGEISWAQNIAQAQKYINESTFDLIVLDINLPDGSGFDFCTTIQMQTPETPVFILSAKSELSEKVLGFSAGADDYITKPFSILELKARIESKLKKMDLLLKASDVISWNELEIHKSKQEVYIFENLKKRSIDLTSLEFKILMFFANQPNIVISRDIMLNEIWGEDIHVYSRSVDTHVSKLRKKLEHAALIIESVHGVGYKFAPTD